MTANNAFYYIHNLYTFIKFKEEIRMANETQKFLSYAGLGTYDSKIKAYIVDKADTAKTSAIAADAVVVTTDVTTEGYAKSYTFTQNGATIATVDIPKDMVVSSGKVVVNPEGQDEGTYLELTLSNATSDKVYINVGKLVDIYTAKANATQVQIAIDSATREVSATIVAGGVGSTELADGAVKTNTSDISTLKTKVADLESVAIEAISTDEINALFTKVTE